jgi:hypothetical protein
MFALVRGLLPTSAKEDGVPSEFHQSVGTDQRHRQESWEVVERPINSDSCLTDQEPSLNDRRNSASSDEWDHISVEDHVPPPAKKINHAAVVGAASAGSTCVPSAAKIGRECGPRATASDSQKRPSPVEAVVESHQQVQVRWPLFC